MRSLTTRIFIVITALLIVTIIGVQVHWMTKTYKFEENEFNSSILKAIRGVYEDLPLLYNSSLMDSLVEKQGSKSYIFQVQHLPVIDSLVYYVSSELEDFKVFTDCRLALYDQGKNRFVFEKYLSNDASHKNENRVENIPLIKKNFNYVLLYFPNRNDYIITQMSNWIVASVLLLALLVAFAFSIYYLYRQKFLFEVQKDFINNVTHEFSTPLSVIEISAEGLSKPEIVGKPEKYAKYAQSIKFQSDYLKTHIANLVRTVVVGNYRFAINKKQIIPNELVNKVLIQLEPLMLKKRGHVQLDLEKPGLSISADEENLYLAVFNIVNNAIKYSTCPLIVIKTWRMNENYYISIGDNGVGIESTEIKKIFRKFYRVQKGDVHSNKGLGLGLYFTNKVIKGHKGTIAVNSIPAKGSEFIIQLPVNT